MPAQVALEISVIIPTYNRKASLLRTLESLGQQMFPADRLEVVVVDDGGSDGTDAITESMYPFRLLCVRQTNQGSAAARNHGAQQSTGDILVFIDDDMTLHSGYLAALADKTFAGTLAMGVWQPYKMPNPSPFSNTTALRLEAQAARVIHDHEVPFAECTSNNLAVRRSDFGRIGMWQDVLGDGPTLWGDVEFGYRAWRMGCRFVRITDAKLIHRDQHVIDLASATRRAYHVSSIVQPLFVLHPEIREHLPMFHDKGPIAWLADAPALIARKLARQTISSPPVLRGTENLTGVMERHWPSPALLERLYRWIISAYIYRGYRQGLQDLDTWMSSFEGEQEPGLGNVSPEIMLHHDR